MTEQGDVSPLFVQVPVTWNDADRATGIDHWIATATYWYEQAQKGYLNRDEVVDLQGRIDRTVRYLTLILDGPLDSTTAEVAEAAIAGLTMPVRKRG